MASQHSSPGGGPGPDPRYAAAFHSDPNPWDRAGYRRATRGRVRTARSLGLLILLLGIAILAAAMFYATTTGGDSRELAAPTPDPNPPAAIAGPVESAEPAPTPTPATAEALPQEDAGEAPEPESPADLPEPAPVEVEETAPEPPPGPAVEPAAAREPETTEPAPDFRAPEHAQQCAANVNWRIYSATEATSCPFSENVAIAMADKAGTDQPASIRADSPVTGRSYEMRCAPEGAGSFTCRGGQGAVVVLEHRYDL